MYYYEIYYTQKHLENSTFSILYCSIFIRVSSSIVINIFSKYLSFLEAIDQSPAHTIIYMDLFLQFPYFQSP